MHKKIALFCAVSLVLVFARASAANPRPPLIAACAFSVHGCESWAGDGARVHSSVCALCGAEVFCPCDFLEADDSEICAVCGDVYLCGEYSETLARVYGATAKPLDPFAMPENCRLNVFRYKNGFVIALERSGVIIEPLGRISVSIPADGGDIGFVITESGVY